MGTAIASITILRLQYWIDHNSPSSPVALALSCVRPLGPHGRRLQAPHLTTLTQAAEMTCTVGSCAQLKSPMARTQRESPFGVAASRGLSLRMAVSRPFLGHSLILQALTRFRLASLPAMPTKPARPGAYQIHRTGKIREPNDLLRFARQRGCVENSDDPRLVPPCARSIPWICLHAAVKLRLALEQAQAHV